MASYRVCDNVFSNFLEHYDKDNSELLKLNNSLTELVKHANSSIDFKNFDKTNFTSIIRFNQKPQSNKATSYRNYCLRKHHKLIQHNILNGISESSQKISTSLIKLQKIIKQFDKKQKLTDQATTDCPIIQKYDSSDENTFSNSEITEIDYEAGVKEQAPSFSDSEDERLFESLNKYDKSLNNELSEDSSDY